MRKFRVVTYNVHKCQGMEGKVSPQRIVDVLKEVDADIIALQEVLSIPGALPEENQAQFIADGLGLQYSIGENRKLRGGLYGNVVLSHFPMSCVRNYDISVTGRERRGCLHIDVDLEGDVLHIFNVHLGTGFMERRHQGRRLIEMDILANRALKGCRVMLGDFNEWVPGLASKLLASHLRSVDIRTHLKRSSTYPGIFPFMHLDHVYFEDRLDLEGLMLHRSRLALMASDHLPLVADFRFLSPSCRDGSVERAEPAVVEDAVPLMVKPPNVAAERRRTV